MELPCNPPIPDRGAGTGRGLTAGPHFCPRCGHVAGEETRLCRECGDVLTPQGYCAVCEAAWPLPAGTPCPKHDLALESWRARTDAVRGPLTDEKWVTLSSFADALRAEAPRIRLEAEGIPTVLEGERMGGPSMYQLATGGVKLQVPESLVADARILLSQSWTTTAESEEDDLDDAWDDLAPDPGATWRDLGRAAVLFVLLAPLLLSLLSLLLGGR
jgi:hypothetical protein